MKLTRTNLSLTLVCLLLGLLLSFSFLTQERARTVSPRGKELLQVIERLEQQRTDLQKTLREHRQRVSAFEKKAAAKEGLLSTFTAEDRKLKGAAGLLALEGEGLEVLLSDGVPNSPDVDPNDFLIHYVDIQAAVNALWAGGAEAISVNGERLVASSEIRCAGNTILTNSRRLGNPYRVKAIGNPDRLAKALEKDPSFRLLRDDYAKRFGLGVEVTPKSQAIVPAFKGSVHAEYARVFRASVPSKQPASSVSQAAERPDARSLEGAAQ